ncbi:MAG: TIGR00159 family protein [Ruminococcaceae bacterium]|jgi:diadenylate cyclase|nr:TIGR00159 family protein [Oscillospiraceae bacterium]
MIIALTIKDVINEMWGVLKGFNWLTDLLDIVLVAFILYGAFKLIRDSKAMQLVKGILLLAVLYAVVTLLKMQASSYLFSILFGNLFLMLVIVFTPEIRNALESVGRTSVFNLGNFLQIGRDDLKRQEQMNITINAVCKEVSELSDSKTGALIVFEKDTNLGEIIKTGTIIDAKVTPELLGNIFYPKAPLHDGAVIIRNSRVAAAGCILPLTFNSNIGRELGTRHRAAIGMSEESDAIIVIVSEESGSISFAYKGRLKHGISEGELREILTNQFLSAEKVDRDSKRRKKNKEEGK